MTATPDTLTLSRALALVGLTHTAALNRKGARLTGRQAVWRILPGGLALVGNMTASECWAWLNETGLTAVAYERASAADMGAVS
jgi:hypothetical protein